MKSREASVSKLTSTPALKKSMSTVTLPVTTKAPLGREPSKSTVNEIKKSESSIANSSVHKLLKVMLELHQRKVLIEKLLD